MTKNFSLRSRLRSFLHAGRGILLMFKSQHNAWIHLLALVVVVGLSCYLRINTMEWTVIVFAIGLVLVAELCNTAIEYLGDAVTEENNDKIKNA